MEVSDGHPSYPVRPDFPAWRSSDADRRCRARISRRTRTCLFGPPQTFPAGQVCPFQVTLTAIEDDLVQTTLTRNTVLITGPLVLEVTNDETGESVIRDVSGPATITQTGETSITVLLAPVLQ